MSAVGTESIPEIIKLQVLSFRMMPICFYFRRFFRIQTTFEIRCPHAAELEFTIFSVYTAIFIPNFHLSGIF